MNAADSVDELTGRIARLYVASPSIEPTSLGVDAALHGRGATLALAHDLVRHAVGRTSAPRDMGLDDLHRHSPGVLLATLAAHPRPAALASPIDVTLLAVRGSTTALWEQAGAVATAAHAQWQAAARRPSGDERWTLLADAAVLTTAVSHLDRRLLAAAEQAGRSDVTAALTHADAHALQVASGAALHDAALGDLPRWSAQPPRGALVLPVALVRDAAELPRGLQRLAEVLHGSLRLTPSHAGLLVRSQLEMAELLTRHARAADALAPGRGLDGLARVAADHHRLLQAAWPASARALSMLEAGDLRPVQQAGECVRALRTAALPTASAGGGGVDADQVRVLRASVRGLLRATAATSAAADSQVHHGRWLTPRPVETSTDVHAVWRSLGPPGSPSDPSQTPLVGLHAAAVPARRVLKAADAVGPAPGRAPLRHPSMTESARPLTPAHHRTR